jgi:hypothetical protein
MGLFDSLLGRTKPTKPDLDQLFALPSAAITLEASLGFTPTGVGSVCFRAPEGKAFSDLQSEITALLDADAGPKVELRSDEFGYTWLVVRADPTDIAGLVTDLHAVNSSLSDAGFGPMLLASLVSFRDGADRTLGLVYLFKRGSFYPFVPTTSSTSTPAAPSESATNPSASTRPDTAPPDVTASPRQRDNVLELQVRDLLRDDVRVEPDLTRWFAVWGAPGL